MQKLPMPGVEPQRWCTGVKGLSLPHYTAKSNFYTRRRKNKIGVTVSPQSTCKDCCKARATKWNRENPEKHALYNSTWYYRNLEDRRIIARERARMVRGKFHHVWKQHTIPEEDVRLDPGPFSTWIEENVVPLLASITEVREATGHGGGAVLGLLTWKSIEEIVGCSEGYISGILKDRRKTIPREIVDRVGILFGNMNLSDELYPEQQDAA